MARDRLGIKPLYYSEGSNGLLFGSETKAILQDGIERDVDLQALHDYLSLQLRTGAAYDLQACPLSSSWASLDVLGKKCGHYTLLGASIPAYPRLDGKGRSEQSYCEELYELLTTTVKQHLISDVPLGVFLSGGIDSSTLVALMSKVSSQPIRTFSIGFEETSYNELDYARAVAKKFDTEHHELVVSPNIVDLLPELVHFFDEPFADSSAIPVYCVSKLAREHVKVALSGEGGRGVCGVSNLCSLWIAEFYKRLPKSLAATIIPAIVRQTSGFPQQG